MSVHGEHGCPEAVLASIAWYPDALDEERRGMVEAHVAACEACREELAFVQGELEPGLMLPDADDVYAGVMARIEQSELPRADTRGLHPRQPLRRPPPRRRTRMGDAFGARPAMLAASLTLALLCGALGALGGMLLAADGASYQTAAEVPAPVAAASGAAQPARPALDVVFRTDVRADQIHAALRAIGGQIVSGPTQIGVYRVELAEEADVAAAAKLLEGEGQGVAAFAQAAR